MIQGPAESNDRPRESPGTMSFRRLRLVALGVSFCALVPASSAQAEQRGTSLFAPLGLNRMAELATQVVAGTIEEMEGTWNADHSRIHTRITLRVERVLAGGAGETVVFRIPGGTVGDTTVLVSEMPRFRIGETVVVFLRGSRGRLPSVLGGSEGRLPLSRGPDGALELRFSVQTADSSAAGNRAGASGSRTIRRLHELEAFVRAHSASP